MAAQQCQSSSNRPQTTIFSAQLLPYFTCKPTTKQQQQQQQQHLDRHNTIKNMTINQRIAPERRMQSRADAIQDKAVAQEAKCGDKIVDTAKQSAATM
jgi:hypothetical protein